MITQVKILLEGYNKRLIEEFTNFSIAPVGLGYVGKDAVLIFRFRGGTECASGKGELIKNTLSKSPYGLNDTRTWQPKIVFEDKKMFAVFDIDESRKETGTLNAIGIPKILEIDENNLKLEMPILYEKPEIREIKARAPIIREAEITMDGGEFVIHTKTITTIIYK